MLCKCTVLINTSHAWYCDGCHWSFVWSSRLIDSRHGRWLCKCDHCPSLFPSTQQLNTIFSPICRQQHCRIHITCSYLLSFWRACFMTDKESYIGCSRIAFANKNENVRVAKIVLNYKWYWLHDWDLWLIMSSNWGSIVRIDRYIILKSFSYFSKVNKLHIWWRVESRLWIIIIQNHPRSTSSNL